MAYDKVIDSAKLDTDLTTVADAIRAKGGTTDPLSFPTGFADAISAIQAGGGGAESVLYALIDRSITEITSNATSIGEYAFYSCNSLTTVNFPVATSIGNYAFYSCDSLTTVNFPVATSIGEYAFRNCDSLTTVNFPVATSIRRNAFYNCYSLTTLILRSETKCNLSDKNAFGNCYHMLGTTNSSYNPDGLHDGYIYVPSALIESYQADSTWSSIALQFRALEDYTVDGTITGELDETKI